MKGYKLKWQQNIITHRLEGKKGILQSAGEGVEQLELSHVASINAKWYSHFRKPLISSYS